MTSTNDLLNPAKRPQADRARQPYRRTRNAVPPLRAELAAVRRGDAVEVHYDTHGHDGALGTVLDVDGEWITFEDVATGRPCRVHLRADRVEVIR